MALDTRDKRASALGAAILALTIFPTADGALSQADRQQVAGYYAGIAAGTLAALLIRWTNEALSSSGGASEAVLGATMGSEAITYARGASEALDP